LDFYYLFGNAIVTVAEFKTENNPTMVLIVRHPGGRTAWKFENKLKTDEGNNFTPNNNNFIYSIFFSSKAFL
jgi:hypothetical protein